MSTPEPGWYDDPWSPAQYRYWDGVRWTPHVAQRAAPAAATAPSAPPAYSTPPATPGAMPGTAPGAPPPYTGYASGPDLSRPTFGPTTPDGVALSGWWRRVGAKVLDGLIVFVLALPLSGYFWYQAAVYANDEFDRATAATSAGRDPGAFDPNPSFYTMLLVASLLTTLVGVVYEAVLLRRSGATWGKRAAGIKVRPRERDVQLSWGTIAGRIGFVEALSLLSAIPLIGIVFGIAALLDNLWPLWDSKNQALHDKVAGTNVVRTRW